MPLYALGLMGATRRMQHYSDTHWQPFMLVALAGAVLILLGIVLTGVQVAVSIRQRERHRDMTGDPWNGRTLEWSTPSPPPPWNFSLLPQVRRPDAFWGMKQQPNPAQQRTPHRTYETIHIPRNNAAGFYLACFAVLLGFSLIWRIWWGAGLGILGAIAVGVVQAWRTDGEIAMSAEQVMAFDRLHGAKEPAA
jgi:cytochrome o ubiquinol oxidase subunit 1